MADVIIKDVPVGAEQAVKDLALVAIDRFIKARDVKVAEAVQTKYESDIDAICIANDLPKKFEKEVTEKVIEEIV